jgi:heat shock protein HslJ
MLRSAALALILLSPAVAQAEATRTVAGTLNYLQRIALAPGAVVTVQALGLRDVVLGQTSFATQGAQVPLPFSLTLPAGPAATVMAAIRIDGDIPAFGGSAALPAGSLDADLGELRLTPDAVTPPPAPYRASGNEPGWVLTATDQSYEFTVMGQEPVRGTLPAATWQDGAAVWQMAGSGLTVRMTAATCRDNMTGMPHPERVTVETADGPRSGCGGDPVTLLTGGAWVVEDVGGRGIPDNAHVTMTFDPSGSVYGAAGCNRYNGAFNLTGEKFGFGPAAATRMACAAALMNLESAFFQAMASVTRFDIAETGALILYAADGKPVLRAFKS